ncbi:DUF6911 family protein [Pseudomonas sp. SDO52101_S400]
MRRSLSWVVGFGRSCKGGMLRDPLWSDVLTYLEKSCRDAGSVTMDVDELAGFELLTLQVIADAGKYVLTLGVDDGNEYDVRVFSGNENVLKKLHVQGELVDSSMVCLDSEIVVEVFRQLFDSGQVSRDLMC